MNLKIYTVCQKKKKLSKLPYRLNLKVALFSPYRLNLKIALFSKAFNKKEKMKINFERLNLDRFLNYNIYIAVKEPF
jgi:hypothetical protein